MDGLASEANLRKGGTLTPKLGVEVIELAVGRATLLPTKRPLGSQGPK